MINTTTVNLGAIDRIVGKVKALDSIDFTPLMEAWRIILIEDNENSLGIDGYGVPLQEVTYRPNPNKEKPTDYTILRNNNLTSSHYRTLDGPPLAPRGKNSRVVTNFKVEVPTGARANGEWYVLGAWEDFLSVDDLEILPFHSAGRDHNPRLPIRDLIHVRPNAFQKAHDALERFIRAILGKIFNGPG